MALAPLVGRRANKGKRPSFGEWRVRQPRRPAGGVLRFVVQRLCCKRDRWIDAAGAAVVGERWLMQDERRRRRAWFGRIAALMIVLVSAIVAPVAGGAEQAQERITGGVPVKANALPFMAAIWVEGYDLSPWCDGTLIAPKQVLTSASCTYFLGGPPFEGAPMDPGSITVSFQGQGSTLDINDAIAVRKVTRYPGFDIAGCLLTGAGIWACLDDAAVLELASAPKGIDPVALVASGDGSFEHVGDKLTIAGWSGKFVNAPPTGKLTQGTVSVIRESVCTRRYEQLNSNYDADPEIVVDTTGNFCSYRTAVGPCYEEIGGPAMAKHRGEWVQVGISNSIQGCAQAKWPTIHTRISEPDMHRWIAKTANLPSGKSATSGKGGR